MKHIVFLTCENLDKDELEKLSSIVGQILTDEDELECYADYDLDVADPSVGINSDQCSVNFVLFEKHDVSKFFDMKELTNVITEERAIDSDSDNF